MFLVTAFLALTWWQMGLWVVYMIYFLIRAYHIWDETSTYGIKKGYKHIIVGHNDKHYRLYHLVRTLFDLPPMAIGLLFPVLSKVLSLKIYTFKEEKKDKTW
ncbi:hypothetical protein AB3N02_22210 [Priestia aryabhattai]|uniref:hypothetical protein n=1 Tax=Priestia aryabhattai TaxID=412384 RepID=UPI0039A3D678